MTDDLYVYDGQVARGVGSVGNGDLVVILLDDTYVFDPADATVADVAAAEVAGIGYLRATISATVELLDGVWRAMPDSSPVIDCTDVPNRGGVLVARDGSADTDRMLVKWSPAVGGGEVAFEPFWPAGIVSDEVSTTGQDLATHVATTVAHGLPALVGVPDGKVLGVVDEAWALTDGGSGGGGTGTVVSVNGDAGPAVVLSAADVGAVPAGSSMSVVNAGSDLTVARPVGVGAVYWRFDVGTVPGVEGENIVHGLPGDLVFVASV